MFEELFFAVVTILVVIVIFIVVSLRSRFSEESYRLGMSAAKEKLLIAERKFMQGKIRKGVFESLVSQLEEEFLRAELSLYRMEKLPSLEVSPKAEKIISVLAKPTGHRRARINSILKETELIRHEMSLLESKLLKRQIRDAVFEKMISQKESELIAKEKELSDVVSGSGSALPFSEKQ